MTQNAHSRYQSRVIKRYYENLDAIMLRKRRLIKTIVWMEEFDESIHNASS